VEKECSLGIDEAVLQVTPIYRVDKSMCTFKLVAQGITVMHVCTVTEIREYGGTKGSKSS